ncbi:MAG: choice-of-anchor D domain-containing protein, partial [Verrucomicrobiota bacterium]
IANNDADENPFDIDLGGTGTTPVGPDITVEQPVGNVLLDGLSTVDFGPVVFNSPTSLIVTVRNTGTANVNGLQVSLDGPDAPDFTAVRNGPAGMAPGGTRTITVSFSPSALGPRSATLRITSNDPDESPFDIDLVGTGEVVPGVEIVVEQPVGVDLIDGSNTVDFGLSDPGVPASPRTFTLRNVGTDPLTNLTITMAGANPGDFVAGPLGTNSVNSGESTTVTITFTPGAAGPRAADLRIASNDPDENPFDVMLTGDGTVSGPEIAVEQPANNDLTDGVSSILFGSPPIGNPAPPLTFTIRNLGDAPLTGLLVTIDGANPADFVAGPPGTNSLNPGETTTVTLTFTPAAFGPRSAALHIASNDSDENPFDIALSGSAAAPEIAVEQPPGSNLVDGVSSVDFGPIVLGTTNTLIVTVRNLGNANLTGLNVSLDGVHAADFTAVRNGPAGAAPGGTRNITLTFSPGALGVRTAALHIASNDPDENPFDLELVGTGIPLAGAEIAVEQPAGNGLTDGLSLVNVGNANPGTPTPPLSFVIRNLGSDPLTNLAVTIDGPHAADFVAAPPGTTVLNSGETTTVTVVFTPGAGGPRTAALHIVSNDADENPFDIDLTGGGIEPDLAVEQPVGSNLVDGVSVVDFGSAVIGASNTLIFTLRNTGNANIQGLAVNVIGLHAVEFTAVRNGPPGMPPGATRTVTVTFSTASVGPRTATLQVTSNDPDESPFDIDLIGTGLPVAGVEIA